MRIQELRLTIMGREQRLTLSVPSERPQEIHDLLDELFNTPQRPGTPGAKIDLAQTKVTRAKLRVVFPLLGAKPKSRSFYVTFPNACTLKPDGLDRVIHQMLVDSGLEKPPAPPRSRWSTRLSWRSFLRPRLSLHGCGHPQRRGGRPVAGRRPRRAADHGLLLSTTPAAFLFLPGVPGWDSTGGLLPRACRRRAAAGQLYCPCCVSWTSIQGSSSASALTRLA